MTANIPNSTRKEVYRRDGWRCVLCDNTSGLQIHHAIPRGHGGSDFEDNLVTLCFRCHAAIHAVNCYDDMPQDEFEEYAKDLAQNCIEYLADMYTIHDPVTDTTYPWYPYK